MLASPPPHFSIKGEEVFYDCVAALTTTRGSVSNYRMSFRDRAVVGRLCSLTALCGGMLAIYTEKCSFYHSNKCERDEIEKA